MSKMICRLCLNDGKVFDIFDSRLTNSEQLIKCILLGTGVEIRREDAVTKYVCQYCSDLAIFLYRYRKKALANDKALKELASQQFTEPLSETTAIVRSNRHLFEGLEAHVQKVVVTPDTSAQTHRKRSVTLNSAVHPTIINLIKTYPRLKIPNDLLQCHIEPRVALNPNDVANWVPPPTPEADLVPSEPISDLERFKMLCPGIHITKVCESTEKVREQPEVVKVNAMNKRKLTESPIDNSNRSLKKRKTSPVITSSKPDCTSSLVAVSATKVIGSKKRRSQTAAPRSEKQIPKLKISLRRSPDHSEINAVVTPVPAILNESKNSEQNLDRDSIEQQPVVRRKRESSREPVVIRQSTEVSQEPSTFPVTKGTFMESLSMQREKDSPQESWVIQRSREPSLESPAVQHNSEASEENVAEALVAPAIDDTTETIAPKILNRANVIDSDSDDDDRGLDTENLLDTFTEEIVISCGVCSKMFATRQHLKLHERVHQSCTICKIIFRSLNALIYHQREVCFKKVIANPPNLALVRVDKQPEMAKLYMQALIREKITTVPNKENEISDVLYISDDDDVIIVDQSTQVPQEIESEDYRQSPAEFQVICRLFGKYRNLILPNTKIKATETKPRIFIRYNSKSQIVLENMFSELQNYRVPVELVAKPNAFAYISFTKVAPEENNIYCWASEPVIGLSEKNTFLSILLNTQTNTSDIQLTPQPILLAQPENRRKTMNNLKSVQIPTTMVQSSNNQLMLTQPMVNQKQPPIIMNNQPPVNVQTSTSDIQLTPQPILLAQPENRPKTINNLKSVKIPTTMVQSSNNQLMLTQPTVNQNQPPIIMNNQPSINVPPNEIFINRVPVTQNPINMIQPPLQFVQPPNRMTQSTLAISQPLLNAAIPRNPHDIYSHKISSISNSAYFGTIVTPSALMLSQPAPSTSTSNDSNFGLRVKSLSELS